jgi:hypothetical protein
MSSTVSTASAERSLTSVRALSDLLPRMPIEAAAPTSASRSPKQVEWTAGGSVFSDPGVLHGFSKKQPRTAPTPRRHAASRRLTDHHHAAVKNLQCWRAIIVTILRPRAQL